MRRNSVLVAVLVALVLAACGGSAAVTTTTSSPATTSSLPPVEAQVLSYSLEAGATYTYAVELEQTIDMSATGSGAAFGDEDLPGSAGINVRASGTFTYTVAAGSEAGTYRITITGEFDEVTADGVVDGEQIDAGQVPDFAELAPVDITIVVDEQGNVVTDDSGVEDPLSGMFGGLESLSGMPGSSPAQFFGPPFADESVTVGSSWESVAETPGAPGADPIVTTTRAAVTGTESVSGVDLLVIESETDVSAIEFDLAEFFIGFFTAFMPANPTPEEQAEIDAMVENLRFAISVDATHSTSTTLFDPAEGITHRFEASSASNIAMDVNFPDEATGELAGFVMDMTLDQTIRLELVSGPAA